MEPDAQSKKVRVRKTISPGLREVMLDGNQITQALLNLVLNALQNVDAEGAIELGAGLTEDGLKLHIWVQDDGPGIPADLMQKIFDPFFTTREQGTGLGLAIVHKIAENHHGEIQVENPPPGVGRGVRFTMVIPL
jgi:signal transduction histidine kinase